jgi:hypothetical protein
MQYQYFDNGSIGPARAFTGCDHVAYPVTVFDTYTMEQLNIVGVNEFRDPGCPAGYDPDRPVDVMNGIVVVRTYPYPL